MTFDPSTAYVNDWRYMDFVEEVIWEHATEKLDGLKGRREDINHPDFAGLAFGLGLTIDATAWTVWNPTDVELNPESGHILRSTDGEGWVVQSFRKSRFGNWQIVTDKARVNAAE